MSSNKFILESLVRGLVYPVLPSRKTNDPAWQPAKVEEVETPDIVYAANRSVAMVMPFWYRIGTEQYDLPVEPLVTVSGGNNIIMRNVAKKEKGGTVKERWTEQDYKISVSGMLFGKDAYSYPGEEVKEIYRLCTTREPIEVTHPLLEYLKITHIVVESYEFPFTKGENMQAFVINAVSDNMYQLFIDLK